MICVRAFCSWNIQLKRNLNDWEADDMAQLLGILEAYRLRDNEMVVERVWLLDKEK